MNRKTWGIVAVVLAVVGAGLVFTLSSQAAVTSQPAIQLPAPQTLCVKLAKMGHFFGPVGTTKGFFAATNGSITAQVGSSVTTSDGRPGVTFSVKGFNTSGRVEGLGEVDLSLDTSRTPDTSTFILNSGTGNDGATQRINFYVTGKVNGQELHSKGQVTLLGTSVQAFPPPEGTVYELASEVTLLDKDNRAVFVLPVGQAAKITR